MDLKEICIDSSISVEQALQQLDKSAQKILFVLENGKLKASLTDGDVRRYLLAGGNIGDNVMLAAHLNPRVAYSIVEARSILRSTKLQAIPVIDDCNEPISIATGKHLFYSERSSKMDVPIVIMAGGKGTRLEPYTKVLPKPLIPVGDIPIIEHIMDKFEQHGCHKFHLIVNHKKELIKAYFSESQRKEDITYYDEEKPLGTGGGLYMLKGKIQETFFLTNCDILIKADYETLLRFHKKSGNTITVVCANKHLTIPYGVIEIDNENAITKMTEKPNFSFLTNTGFYIVEPDVLNDIEDHVPTGFPDIMVKEQMKKKKIGVFVVDENDWLDMGQLTGLENMREQLETQT